MLLASGGSLNLRCSINLLLETTFKPHGVLDEEKNFESILFLSFLRNIYIYIYIKQNESSYKSWIIDIFRRKKRKCSIDIVIENTNLSIRMILPVRRT